MFNNAEIYVDTFSFLDRDHLEVLQLCRRYFRSLVDEHMSTVCWRRIALAELERSEKRPGVTQYSVQVELDDDNQTGIDRESEDFEEAALWLVNTIRCSVIESLDLTGLRLTPAFADQLLAVREIFNTKVVSFYGVDLSLVSAPLLHSLLVDGLVGLRNLSMKNCHNASSDHFGDSLLKNLMEKRVFKISLDSAKAPQGEYYNISADTILKFCFGHEACKSVSRELDLGHVHLPSEFCDAVLERHKQSALKSRLDLKLHGIRVEQQRVEHLYRNRQVAGGVVVFEFCDEGPVPLQLHFWRQELQLTVCRGDL